MISIVLVVVVNLSGTYFILNHFIESFLQTICIIPFILSVVISGNVHSPPDWAFFIGVFIEVSSIVGIVVLPND